MVGGGTRETDSPLCRVVGAVTGPAPLHLVWRADSEQSEGLTKRDLHRLHQTEARLRALRIGFVDDTVIAIEAVERAGELERVGRELMDAVVLADVVDELGEPQNEPDEIELPLRCQQRRVGSVGLVAVDDGLLWFNVAGDKRTVTLFRPR